MVCMWEPQASIQENDDLHILSIQEIKSGKMYNVPFSKVKIKPAEFDWSQITGLYTTMDRLLCNWFRLK